MEYAMHKRQSYGTILRWDAQSECHEHIGKSETHLAQRCLASRPYYLCDLL